MKTLIITITVISLILFSGELPIIENDVGSKEKEQDIKHNIYDEVIQYYLSNFEYEEHIPKSTVIHKLRYFENTKRKILLIYFTSSPKKGYIYEGISVKLWSKFKMAESKGRFYNSEIKNKAGRRSYSIDK